MKFLLLLSFSNLTLPSPTVYDIFIFSLERYLVKLFIGFSLASRLWSLFQLQILKKRSQVWLAGYENAKHKPRILGQEHSILEKPGLSEQITGF
jgi:hypothetical protein